MGKPFTPFAKNVSDLIASKGESVLGWCKRNKKYGLVQSRVNRGLNGTNDISLETVQQIADATGYEPWQLFHPDFKPGSHPPMMDAETMRVAAIFANIKNDHNRRVARAIMEQFEGVPEDVPSLPMPTLQTHQ